MQQILDIRPITSVVRHPTRPGIKSLLRRWIRNHETRKLLKEMEEHRLRDIGIGRTQAEAEAGKPFWR